MGRRAGHLRKSLSKEKEIVVGMERIKPVLKTVKTVVDYLVLHSWSLADLINDVGLFLYYDDEKDVNNPDAHPGLHHWHIGRAMVILGDVIKEITR